MSSNFAGLDYIICECGVNFNNEKELQAHLQNEHITNGSDDGETDFYILEVEDENDACYGNTNRESQMNNFVSENSKIKLETKAEYTGDVQLINQRSQVEKHNIAKVIHDYSCNENSIREDIQTQNFVSKNLKIRAEPNVECTRDVQTINQQSKVEERIIAKVINDYSCNRNSNREDIQMQNFVSNNLKIKVEPNVECTRDETIEQQSKFDEYVIAKVVNNLKTEPETLNYVVVNSDLTHEAEIVNFDVEFGNEIVLEDNVSYAHDVKDLVIAEIPNRITTENINSDQIMFCELCEKVFVGEQTFQEHYDKVHTIKSRKKAIIKTWTCHICEKNFASKTSLQSHIYTHTGERPFRCSTCDASFAVKLRLQIHERIHTDERPYQCECCPKAFRNKAAINRHSRVHTGVKPYACPQCGKTFTQSNSMKLHVRTVHLKEPAPYKSKKRMMRDLMRTRDYEGKTKKNLYRL